MSAKQNWKIQFGLIRQDTKKWPEQAKNKLIKEFMDLQNLIALIHSEVEPTFEAIRKADLYASGGYRTQLENSPELHGVKKSFPEIYRLHMPTGSADVEMDVIDKALVQAIGRNDSPDKPLN